MMPKDFKDIFFSRRNVIFSLCVLSALSISISAQDFKTVHDGVEYAEVTRKIGDDPVKINLLRLDLKKVRLDVHHALDAAIGTEKTTSIAARHGAAAAINAGFFRLDKSIFAGDAAGILRIDRRTISESNSNRIALGISNGRTRTEVQFAHLTSRIQFVRGVDQTYSISGINRERKNNESILYTPEFGRTTLTNDEGFEIVVKGRVGEPIIVDKGNNTIPPDGYIISFGKNVFPRGDTGLLAKQNIIRVGTSEQALVKKLDSYFDKAEDIVAGVPQLIKNGRIDITWEQEKSSKAFVETRHPRTAVAKMKDGKFLMITVDGRQPGVSVGMNLNELAAYLLELGAVEAMNLDGGGSTTMFLDGRVVNKPSDKDGERKVSDAILVTLRKKR